MCFEYWADAEHSLWQISILKTFSILTWSFFTFYSRVF